MTHSEFVPDTGLVGRIHPSPNIEPRRGGGPVDILILHYTGFVDAERAIDWLARPESKVSCHYVIDLDGTVTQMVRESERAWHAGQSFWKGERDINSRSIGIEIQNPGHDRGYPDFPDRQIEAVIALSRDIARRYRMPAEHILAHSDIAPRRKIDPGEKFDWGMLAAGGVGHWVGPEPAGEAVAVDPGRFLSAQRLLADYGYECPLTGVADPETQIIVTAFQRHFRPERVDGVLDRSTMATLERLVAALPPVPRA